MELLPWPGPALRLEGGCSYYHAHFTEEETESQRGVGSCPSHSWQAAGLGLEPRSLGSTLPQTSRPVCEHQIGEAGVGIILHGVNNTRPGMRGSHGYECGVWSQAWVQVLAWELRLYDPGHRRLQLSPKNGPQNIPPGC